MNLVVLIIAVVVVTSEIANLNTQKSQTIDLVQQTEYKYDARDALSLIIGHWFFTTPTFEHIRKYQNDNRNNPDAIKHKTRPNGLIPQLYSEFDYYDRMFVQDYMCSRLKTKYRSIERFDAIGTVAWSELIEFNFRCEFMQVVNDKIRIRFWIPYAEQSLSNFTNTSPFGAGRQSMSTEDREKTIFKRSTAFKAQLVMEYDESLTGLRTYTYALHTKEAANLTKYNNWNFTTSRIWDSVEEGFWFAANTTILWNSVVYTVGQEQVALFGLELQPEFYVHKGQGSVNSSIFGIPTSYNDRISSKLLWSKASDINEDGRVETRSKFNSTKQIVTLNFAFTQRRYTL